MNTETVSALLTVLVAVIIVGSFIFINRQFAGPWSSPMRAGEKLARGARVGLGVTVSGVSFLVLLGMLGGEEVSGHWRLRDIIGLACFVLPFGVMAGVGSLLGLGVLDALKKKAQDLAERDATGSSDQ